MTKPKLWHCCNTRSLRPLWAMEEMGIDYDLEVLPFPPRVLQREYLAINPLGTVPYFVYGDITMTESTAICHYLVECYQKYQFGIKPEHPEFGNYLNWLYQADATLTFPQTIVLRYKKLELEERRLPQAVKDYGLWYLSRLRLLDKHLRENDYLCDGRFTIADIAISYALYLGEKVGLDKYYKPRIADYLARMKTRNAFARSVKIGSELDPFSELPQSYIDLD